MSILSLGLTTHDDPPRPSIRQRLWQGGGLVALFLLTLVIGNVFLPADRAVTRNMIGLDFLPFYFAGTCVRTGRLEQLYDLDATRTFEAETARREGLEMGPGFGPWWNPPFAAWAFEPFAGLPFKTAVVAWWACGFAALGGAIALLTRMIPGGWRNKGLVPLLVLTCLPCFMAFSHGQNTFVSLLILTTVVTLWRSAQPLWAGIAAGLLFYKPQLGALVAIVLIASEGRRAMLGVAMTGTALLLVNVATLPGTLSDWLFKLPGNLHWMQEKNRYLWERHVTFKAFWRLMLQGRSMGPTSTGVKILWGLSEAALLAGLAWAATRSAKAGTSVARDRLIAATVASMPLLMPFYFDYDLLLVSVAAVVYAADRLRPPAFACSDRVPEDRWIVMAWAALYVELFIGTWFGGHTRFHLTVAILTSIAVMLVRKAVRTEKSIVDVETRTLEVIPLARAA